MNSSTLQCRCGHQHEAHEHYRRGSDCAICGAANCSSFVARDVDSASAPASTVADAGLHPQH